MREMLSTPGHEFPAFPAVLAHLPLLSPEDARAQLDQRAQALAAEIERIDTELGKGMELVPRLFLLELEYLRAIASMELTWVQSIVEELITGQLTWNEEWLRAVAAQFEQRAQQPRE
jgi:hypothetical protein